MSFHNWSENPPRGWVFSLSFRVFFGGRAVLKKPGLPGILCTVVACPRISNLLLSTYCCFLPDCIAIHTKLFWQPKKKSTCKRSKKVVDTRKKCESCDQYTEDNPNLQMFEGAHNAEDEVVAFSPCSPLAAEYREQRTKSNDEMEDQRPEWRLTAFTFFCEKGHLVPFDRKVCSSVFTNYSSM